MHASGGKWLPAPHLLRIDREVCDLLAGRLRENVLLIYAPPRHGKSEFISRYLTAFHMLRWPEKHVMLASYAATLAQRWGRAARSLVDEFGWGLSRVRVNPARKTAGDWEIEGHGGRMLCNGVGGAFTGFGGHLSILDDTIKDAKQALSPTVSDGQWDWYQSTFATRREPGGKMIAIGTRWSDDDLLGRIEKQSQEEHGEPVRVLRLPALAEAGDPLGREPGEALWEDRWPRANLERTRLSTESFWYNALYQGAPEAHRFAEWPKSYFGSHIWFDQWPPEDEIALKILTLDPALGRTSSSDYSAYTMLAVAKGGLCYIDADIDRRDISRMLSEGKAIVQWFRPDEFGMEEQNFHGLELHVSEQWGGLQPLTATITQHTDKIARIKTTLGPLLNKGLLRFKRGSLGVDRLLEQMRGFPKHQHDDGPDSLEMAIRMAAKHFPELLPQGRYGIAA